MKHFSVVLLMIVLLYGCETLDENHLQFYHDNFEIIIHQVTLHETSQEEDLLLVDLTFTNTSDSSVEVNPLTQFHMGVNTIDEREVEPDAGSYDTLLGSYFNCEAKNGVLAFSVPSDVSDYTLIFTQDMTTIEISIPYENIKAKS